MEAFSYSTGARWRRRPDYVHLLLCINNYIYITTCTYGPSEVHVGGELDLGQRRGEALQGLRLGEVDGAHRPPSTTSSLDTPRILNGIPPGTPQGNRDRHLPPKRLFVDPESYRSCDRYGGGQFLNNVAPLYSLWTGHLLVKDAATGSHPLDVATSCYALHPGGVGRVSPGESAQSCVD